jgi:hypothetical protein
MQPPDRDRRRTGQRDVDGVGGQARVELRARELGAARLERGLERPARLVRGAADRGALVRRQLGDAAQQVGQLGLAPQVGDPRLLELRRAGGRRDRGRTLFPQLLDLLLRARATLPATS